MMTRSFTYLRFTHEGDAMRNAPLLKCMSHVGQEFQYGEKLGTGKDALITAAGLIVGGPVIGAVGVGTYFKNKLEHAHCDH